MNLPLRHFRALRLLPVLGLACLLGPVDTDANPVGPAGHCASHLDTLPVARGQILPDTLKILSWNIHKAYDAGWLEDLQRLGADANLSFIQEATLRARLGELWPGGPIYQSFAQGYATRDEITGVMTLSSHAPTMQCNFTRMEPWLGTPKAATVTEHAIAGHPQRLLAINVHAVNFTLGLSDLQAQLQPLTTLLQSHAGPVILAGDFNTWSSARAHYVDQALRALGLEPLQFEPDLRSTAFGMPLDHIYVRGLAVESTEVVPVSSSDHNPLRASLRLVI
ncbi:endonuclease/exonuclease/phosphatase family protein [Haliea sp. E17]|uniref:endonuclease/exonuclease/phosphatase family protein n=1 Tax=Haliea sp. E17 TaxID=3401576 RepID=UPI003AAC3042